MVDVTALSRRTGAKAFEEHWAYGRGLSTDEAVALAMRLYAAPSHSLLTSTLATPARCTSPLPGLDRAAADWSRGEAPPPPSTRGVTRCARLIPATALAFALALASPTLAAAADGHTKVVEGSDRGTFTTTTLPNGNILTEDKATGQARHVGHYAIAASEQITPTFGVSDGAFTITTSHGTLTGSYAGQAAGTTDVNVITYHAAGPVLSGTGRFAGVAGWLVFDGVANLNTKQLCDHVSGWISTRGDEVDRGRLKLAKTQSTPACQL